MYNLTENQKSNLKWIVEQVRSGNLGEDFSIFYTADEKTHLQGIGKGVTTDMHISVGTMKAFHASNLIVFDEDQQDHFVNYHCTLLGNAYLAVDSEFGEKIGDKTLSYFYSVFGEPNKKYVYDLFVLMPFTSNLKPIYDDHIKPIAAQLKLSAARADDFFSQNSIMEEIWSAIAQASILIADCTNRNPNVFYEIGIAHAIGKPVILITQNSDDVPFDLQHRRYIHYIYTVPGMKKFETDLYKTISETLKDLNSSIVPL